jgi:EmrB/QacA subfamily drug resistance transporter
MSASGSFYCRQGSPVEQPSGHRTSGHTMSPATPHGSFSNDPYVAFSGLGSPVQRPSGHRTSGHTTSPAAPHGSFSNDPYVAFLRFGQPCATAVGTQDVGTHDVARHAPRVVFQRPLVPGSLAIISASFDPSRRGRAIGTWSGFSAIATAAGPVLGGWLVQYASWRAVFFINVPVAAAILFLLYRHVPESRDEEATGSIDWVGALLVTGALAGIVFGLIEAGPRGFGNSVVDGALAGGVVLLAAFVVVEARSRTPMVPLTIFRSRSFTATNLLTLLLYGGLGGGLYFLPFDLQQVQGFSPTAAGASFLPFPVIVFVLSRWAGGLVPRYGSRPPLIIGPVITAAGLGLFAVPGVGASYWTGFFPAVVVMSVGMNLVIAPLTTTVMNALPTHESGVASGVNNAVSRAAGLLAIAALGLVVAATFNASLDARMNSLHVSAPVKAAIDSQRAKFVDASAPAGVSPSERASLKRALKESFVSGFRASMLLAAFLALASAFLTAWLIRDEPRVEDGQGL